LDSSRFAQSDCVASLAKKSFAAGSSMYPCHMACVSKSVPGDVISLSNFCPQRHRCTMDLTHNSWGPITQRPFLVFFRVRCIKYSFHGTALACGFLIEKGCRGLQFNKTALLRTALLMNQNNSGSCRCVWRKSRIGQHSGNDVTSFSNRCCNIGSLLETALWPLSFLLEVLGGRVSPRRRVTLSSLPGDHTEIVQLCSRPSEPKPEIEHNQRGRSMPALT
jgi:hypothetical protein